MDVLKENRIEAARVDKNMLHSFHSIRQSYEEFCSRRYLNFLDRLEIQGKKLGSVRWVRQTFKDNSLRYIACVSAAFALQTLVLYNACQPLFDRDPWSD